MSPQSRDLGPLGGRGQESAESPARRVGVATGDLRPAPPDPPPRTGQATCRVVAVSSNKGGVGKTTVASNLAIYLRALREELPVLILGLDDQDTLDRMFGLAAGSATSENLKHAWARRDLREVLRLGQYGVHYVPSPPDTGALKHRAEDPESLRRMIAATAWPGVIILDTKSDLEELTRSAYHAADRIIVPVADRASLREAAKVFQILEADRLGADRARILFTLVDRRSRAEGGTRGLFSLLEEEVAARGWPRYRTALSRSPRVEGLQSGEGCPQSILHAAAGTAVHRQMRELAEEVLEELALGPPLRPVPDPPPRPQPARSSTSDWKAALLGGVARGLRGKR